MKNFVNTALISLALFAISDNTHATELLSMQELRDAIDTKLETNRTDLAVPDLTEQVEKSMDKALLHQHTDMLIADVREQFPEHRFKIVFTD